MDNEQRFWIFICGIITLGIIGVIGIIADKKVAYNKLFVDAGYTQVQNLGMADYHWEKQ